MASKTSWAAGIVAIIVVAVSFLVLATLGSLRIPNNRRSNETTQLTPQCRTDILNALTVKRYASPSLEITNGGVLVATFELSKPPLSLRSYAEDALITMREAALACNSARNYRVTLNGPSPGTGLIRRYGSARFFEGGPMEWESGINY